MNESASEGETRWAPEIALQQERFTVVLFDKKFVVQFIHRSRNKPGRPLQGAKWALCITRPQQIMHRTIGKQVTGRSCAEKRGKA